MTATKDVKYINSLGGGNPMQPNATVTAKATGVSRKFVNSTWDQDCGFFKGKSEESRGCGDFKHFGEAEGSLAWRCPATNGRG